MLIVYLCFFSPSIFETLDIRSTFSTANVDSDIFKLASFGDKAGLIKIIDGENEFDITTPDIYGRSPLHWAARAGRNECCTYLINMEIDKNASDSAGLSPLLHAAQAGMETTVKLLVEADCDVNVQDSNGNTAMHFAVSKGILGMVQILKEKGASLSLKNKTGFTPAHIAAMNGQLVIARYLVKMVDVKELDSKNDSGDTPLHIASSCGFPNICKEYLTGGCDKEITNGNGSKPLDVATGAAAKCFE